MSLMRALKGVATGYLGARVDMMAQEAAKKREDELLQAEREFKKNQQADLLKGQLHNKIETLIKTEELESDRIRKEKEQKTADLREQLGFMGYTPEMLDLLESQNVLIDTNTYNLWANRFDKEYPNQIDWWTQEGWQEDYITHYTKGTAFDPNSIKDSVKNENAVSDNAAEVLMDGGATTNVATDTTGSTTSVTSATTADDTSTTAVSTDTTQGTVKIKDGVVQNNTNDMWYEKYREVPKPETVILRKSDVNSPYIGLLTAEGYQLSDLPDDGTQVIKLTLDNSTNRYTQSLVTVGETFNEKLASTDARDKNLIGAIVRTPGLFPGGQVDGLYSDATGINTDALASLSKKNALKFDAILDNAYFIEKAVQDLQIENMSAGKIAQMAVGLYNSTGEENIARTQNNISSLGSSATIDDLGRIIIEDIRSIMLQFDNIPSGTAKEKAYYNAYMDVYINRYKDALVAKQPDDGSKTRINNLVDKMMDSIATGNTYDYWNNMPEGRVTEGTFESGLNIDAEDKDLIPGQETGVIMAGAEPETINIKDERDQMNQLLGTLPEINLDDVNVEELNEKSKNKIINNEKEKLSSSEKEEVDFIGGEGVGSRPWLFSNGNFNPAWEGADTLKGNSYSPGTEASDYRIAKADYNEKLEQIRNKEFLGKVYKLLFTVDKKNK